jgi:hypothetical protein
MKKFLFIFWVLFYFSEDSFGNFIDFEHYSKSDSFLTWNFGNLQWSNFLGEPEVNNKNIVAITSLNFEYSYNLINDTLTLKVVSKMYPFESWTISNSLDVLDHEQLHFDICELLVRRFKKKVVTHFNKNKFNKEIINKYYLNTKLELKKLQLQYDKETNCGVITRKQLEWTLKIRKELNELSSFKASILNIYLLKTNP